MDIMYTLKEKEVSDKNEGPKDSALGHTSNKGNETVVRKVGAYILHYHCLTVEVCLSLPTHLQCTTSLLTLFEESMSCIFAILDPVCAGLSSVVGYDEFGLF